MEIFIILLFLGLISLVIWGTYWHIKTFWFSIPATRRFYGLDSDQEEDSKTPES